jgi:hypothetical protein
MTNAAGGMVSARRIGCHACTALGASMPDASPGLGSRGDSCQSACPVSCGTFELLSWQAPGPCLPSDPTCFPRSHACPRSGCKHGTPRKDKRSEFARPPDFGGL